MLNKLISRKFCLITFSLMFVFAILIISISTFAQSGRRVKTIPKTEPVVEIPIPKATPAPTPKPKPQVILSVVSDIRASAFSPLQFPQNTSKWFVERLESSSLIDVKANITGNLKQAKQMALNAEDEYIVFVQFNENSLATQNAGATEALRDIQVNFYVLSPKTGKTKQSGSAYLKPELLRSNGVLNRRQVCYTMLRNADYLLLQASFEAAERIMSGFNLPVPAEKCVASPMFFSLFTNQ